jgi:uncharacterized damage-inducible protein DinB
VESDVLIANHFRTMARNNAWSNHRLHGVCAALTQEEFQAERVSFFPSLERTLNHLLIVDWYYLDGLEGGGRGLAVVENEVPFPRLADLSEAQRAADARLIRYCDGLVDSDVEAVVALDRGDEGLTQESVYAVLSHLFVHQIHHRGQAHAMLSGTRIEPPQLDEFFLAFDIRRREGELKLLGL